MSVPPKFCRACGVQLAPGSALCAACGQAIDAAPAAPAADVARGTIPMVQAPPAPAFAPALAPQPSAPSAPPGYVAQPLLPHQPVYAAPPPVRRQGGAGMFFLGLLIGVLLMSGVMAVLYFLPVHNIANIIGAETPAAQANAPLRHPSTAMPPQPGVVPENESGGGKEQLGEEGSSGESRMGEEGSVTIQYDKFDAQQVMAYMVYAIFQQEPWMMRDLVGPDGCAFAPYATESETPGENNGEEIASETKQALIDSDATCLGYSVTKNGFPDKATIYWLGLNYDWSRLGLGEYAAPTIAFEFFMFDDGWKLCYISPVPDDLAPDGTELLPPPMDFMPAGE